MNAQQAPGLGRAGEARQAKPSAPVQVASMRKKRTSGGTAQAISATPSTVSTMLAGPENRLARIQPNAPARADGGGSGSHAPAPPHPRRQRLAPPLPQECLVADYAHRLSAPQSRPSARRNSSTATRTS